MPINFPKFPKQPKSPTQSNAFGYNQIPNWQQKSGALPGHAIATPYTDTLSTGISDKARAMLESLPGPFKIFHN